MTRSETARIDVVSPLPPVRSGISDYTLDLLPHLAERADVRVVRLPGQDVADEIAERWEPVDAAELGRDGAVPLYQMGNNQHHLEVWRLAMETPGVLVLHDLVLHHFLIERTVKEGDLDAYARALEADHGWIGAAAARTFRWPGAAASAAQFSLPAHRDLLLRQKGVLVHSRWAREVLLEEIPELRGVSEDDSGDESEDGASDRVRALPMGIPLPPAADAEAGRAFRRRRGLPLDRPLLGSFGFQTPMKRTEEVIRALGEAELAEVHLMVAGEVAEILELDRVAEETGVADRVHVLGYLEWSDFADAIAACDLALNLRYPTAGETSASLLRILATGRPAVVSDHAQMAELPDDVVVKIPLGDGERRTLAERLSALLDDRTALERFGAAARRHVEACHRPEDAAEAVVGAVRAWADLEPPAADERPRIPSPTSLAWHDLRGEIEVEGAEAPWSPGERRRLRIRLRNGSDAVWLASERRAGGVAIQARLFAGGEDLLAGEDWRPLPFELPPGGEHEMELAVRRPLESDVRLRILPHVLGFTGLPELGGPSWERRI